LLNKKPDSTISNAKTNDFQNLSKYRMRNSSNKENQNYYKTTLILNFIVFTSLYSL